MRRQGESCELFDWPLYGALVRHHRTKAGIKTAAAFSDAVYERTRAKVSRDSIYKIEQGRQVPDAMQFMAINLALFGEVWPVWPLRQCFAFDAADEPHGTLVDEYGEVIG